MAEASRKRIRRSAEQRLADLEKKHMKIMERQRAAIARIEEQKKRLIRTPSAKKDRVEQEKRFARAVNVIASEWDHRHIIAAVEMALSEDHAAATLAERGEALLEEHGKARRGRRPAKLG
ncbi:hypothetical protein JKG47_22075 [Acidithiobacillus sp. MC6.1]|nr:hypothetical protein [Acidithiobacillus sp. MC6.1]